MACDPSAAANESTADHPVGAAINLLALAEKSDCAGHVGVKVVDDRELTVAEQLELMTLASAGDPFVTKCPSVAKWIVYIIDFYTMSRALKNELTMKLNMLFGNRDERSFEDARSGKSVDLPIAESVDFRTIEFMNDPRGDLKQTKSSSEEYKLQVAVMASKFVYENANGSEFLVRKHLQGKEFMFFNSLNVLQKKNSTQAMAFVRTENTVRVAYVAFRGTEDAVDWAVNFDCNLFEISEEVGSVHIGFMKALAFISNTGSFYQRFPLTLPEDLRTSPPAYYRIMEWLISMTRTLRKGQILHLRVVGHSQGGALAILFAAMMHYRSEIPVNVKVEVITMGQPRVGDCRFARYMNNKVLEAPTNFKYTRMVYSFDPVPRLPSDDEPNRCDATYEGYRHFGDCYYYYNWFTKLKLKKDQGMPIPNIDFQYVSGMFAEHRRQKDMATEPYVESLLKEPLSATNRRQQSWAFLQFHSVGEYLNAARLGAMPSTLNRIFSFFIRPSCFCNRPNRRRRVAVDEDGGGDQYPKFII